MKKIVDFDKEGFKKEVINNVKTLYRKTIDEATQQQVFQAVCYAVKDDIIDRWIATHKEYEKENVKTVYYLSMEFLMGRALGNNLINLTFYDEIKEALDELGFDLNVIEDQEPDAALGNGGLGRLAACFLDSLATLGYPAYGCGFYKIVLLFIIGAFLGDIAETIFCRITMGVWMSRSSVVWGPFSIVWGLAIALVTALLYKYKDRSNTFLFLIGTLLGGAYEYLCSVFTEIFFGKVFWDYSNIPFNLGGRINLLYCFFWGIAAVVWFKRLYPPLEKWIERIPQKVGKIITWGLLVFMCCNIMVSCMALVRYDEREKGIRAETRWEHWTDEHYDDAKMKKIYPNAKGVKKGKTEEKDAGSKAAES